MSARAFIAEVATKNIFALSNQCHPISGADFITTHRFIAAIPDRENDASLRWAIHLHTEVAAMPTAGHVIRSHRVFLRACLAIKSSHLHILRLRVAEMNGCRIAPLFLISLNASGGWTIELERYHIARLGACGIFRTQFDLLVAYFRDAKRPKVDQHILIALALKVHFARGCADQQRQLRFLALRQTHGHHTSDLAGFREAWIPNDVIFLMLPISDRFVFAKQCRLGIR